VFHLVYYKWFRRTRNITELGLDYKEVGGVLVLILVMVSLTDISQNLRQYIYNSVFFRYYISLSDTLRLSFQFFFRPLLILTFYYLIHEVRYYQEYLQSSCFRYDFFFESFYFCPRVNKKISKIKIQ
jgi:hypothetical protein